MQTEQPGRLKRFGQWVKQSLTPKNMGAIAWSGAIVASSSAASVAYTLLSSIDILVALPYSGAIVFGGVAASALSGFAVGALAGAASISGVRAMRKMNTKKEGQESLLDGPPEKLTHREMFKQILNAINSIKTQVELSSKHAARSRSMTAKAVHQLTGVSLLSPPQEHSRGKSISGQARPYAAKSEREYAEHRIDIPSDAMTDLFNHKLLHFIESLEGDEQQNLALLFGFIQMSLSVGPQPVQALVAQSWKNVSRATEAKLSLLFNPASATLPVGQSNLQDAPLVSPPHSDAAILISSSSRSPFAANR